MMLSDVCLSVAYIGPKSRTERPRKTKIGTEVAHVTRDSDTTFNFKKVKGQGHQAALLTAALTREAGAAVTVRTYWAWETTLPLFGGARGAWAPRRRRGAGAYCVATCTACFQLLKDCENILYFSFNFIVFSVWIVFNDVVYIWYSYGLQRRRIKKKTVLTKVWFHCLRYVAWVNDQINKSCLCYRCELCNVHLVMRL